MNVQNMLDEIAEKQVLFEGVLELYQRSAKRREKENIESVIFGLEIAWGIVNSMYKMWVATE